MELRWKSNVTAIQKAPLIKQRRTAVEFGAKGECERGATEPALTARSRSTGERSVCKRQLDTKWDK